MGCLDERLALDSLPDFADQFGSDGSSGVRKVDEMDPIRGEAGVERGVGGLLAVELLRVLHELGRSMDEEGMKIDDGNAQDEDRGAAGRDLDDGAAIIVN